MCKNYDCRPFFDSRNFKLYLATMATRYCDLIWVPTKQDQLMTVERIHPKAPVIFIFITIFTCLPSCINLSNKDQVCSDPRTSGLI